MTYQPYDYLPIEELSLPTRAANCLRDSNIETVGKVRVYDTAEEAHAAYCAAALRHFGDFARAG